MTNNLENSFQELLVFPGQGSQSPGMGKLYFDNFDLYKRTLEEVSDATGLHLKKLSFEASDSEIRSTEIAQPLILTTSIAMFRVLFEELGLKEKLKAPLFAGHSLGEYSALVAGGALSLEVAAQAVHHRGRFMQEAVPLGVGSMRALILREAVAENQLQELCESASREATKKAFDHDSKSKAKLVAVANWNSETQIVVSGHVEALQEIDQLVGKESHKWLRRSIPLDVSAPFHSPLMEPASLRLEEYLKSVQFTHSHHFYIRNIDAAIASMNDSVSVRRALVDQVAGNVRWYPSLVKAKDLGCQKHIEIGFGKVLSGIAGRLELLKEWKMLQFDSDLKKVEDSLCQLL